MALLTTVLHSPRKLWIRRALFQVHLWMGMLLSAYVVVIALSGSVLVFEDELTATTLPAGLSAFEPQRMASIPKVMASFQAAFPGAKASMLTLPNATIPAYRINATGRDGMALNVAADPRTGVPYRMARTWVEWVHDLHLYLLLPHTYGVQVNAVGAAILFLLAATGLVLWWPGVRVWTRGLKIDKRARWRRINYDAHNAMGFWTLAIVVWWAFSGVYFGFYKQVAAAVNVVAPLRNMISPTPLAAGTGKIRASLETVLASASTASPQASLYGLSDPSLATNTVYAYMDLGKPADFTHRDIVAIDTTSGHILSVWHYGTKQSIGDWILWLMHPLHFGTVWGTAVKIVWCLLGVSLALMSGTGLLMYWNRFLRHRWNALF